MDRMISPDGKELGFVTLRHEFSVLSDDEEPAVNAYLLDLADFKTPEELHKYLESVDGVNSVGFILCDSIDELKRNELYVVYATEEDDRFAPRITKNISNAEIYYKIKYCDIIHKKRLPKEDIKNENKVKEYIENQCVTPCYTSPKGKVTEFKFKVRGYKSIRLVNHFLETSGNTLLRGVHYSFYYRILNAEQGEFGIKQATFILRFRYR